MKTIKRIVGLALATMLMASMVAGGVWAYFSDVQASTSNVLLAGTLDLSPSTNGTSSSGNYTVTQGGDQVNGNVVFRKMAPGESGNITWVLTDTGSIAGTLVITSKSLSAKMHLMKLKRPFPVTTAAETAISMLMSASNSSAGSAPTRQTPSRTSPIFLALPAATRPSPDCRRC